MELLVSGLVGGRSGPIIFIYIFGLVAEVIKFTKFLLVENLTVSMDKFLLTFLKFRNFKGLEIFLDGKFFSNFQKNSVNIDKSIDFGEIVIEFCKHLLPVFFFFFFNNFNNFSFYRCFIS